ncbi:MAG: hypothetical protein JW894_16325 [Bacteroidales bacterium]|nr:hypothetical protein [Bacteroidales bacterium]
MKISKYYISLLICLSASVVLFSQEEKEEITRIKGLRIGYDISKLALYYFQPERTAFDFSADIEISRNYYPVFEFGIQNVDLNDSIYNYTSSGKYFRFGLDYNLLKNKRIDQYEMSFIGFRYGMAFLDHSADNIIIANDYWGDYSGGNISQENVGAGWIEIVGGIRGELFKNFFIGWYFSGRILVSKKNFNSMDPYYIPGFGRGDKKTSLGFNYSIYYRIPMFKTKYIKPEK